MASTRITCALTLAAILSPALAHARAPSLAEYRYLRRLSIDLSGRIPTRAELQALEADDFSFVTWVDAHLTSPRYAERLRRVYMDALRIEVGPNVPFVQQASLLRRQELEVCVDADCTETRQEYIYFREGQRRLRDATDGTFCLGYEDTGLHFPKSSKWNVPSPNPPCGPSDSCPTNNPPLVTVGPVAKAAIDANTVRVKPWWLYRDFGQANPTQLFSDANRALFPGFEPVPDLRLEADLVSTTTEIIVCKEEASAADWGVIYKTARAVPPAGQKPAWGRLYPLPRDNTFVSAAPEGTTISCSSQLGWSSSAACGCGKGLERCLPIDGPNRDRAAFMGPEAIPTLDPTLPYATGKVSQADWSRLWWNQEVVHFLDGLFNEDRDFREMLTARYSYVNGPLSQFYHFVAPASCCSPEAGRYFGYLQGKPLFDPNALPPDLLPHDASVWRKVEDRGALASGILTMPAFLSKYGSRRARAHILYTAFQCRELVAETVELAPSAEPNLMVRPGCSTCHTTLEPMAAFFARVSESGWTYLPPENFPALSTASDCAQADATKVKPYCKQFYDRAFSDDTHATLYGGYASTVNTDIGPRALAIAISEAATFAPCVVETVASSFLGRSLGADDAPLKQALSGVFVANAYSTRALVRALVLSDTYRLGNNLLPGAWRRANPLSGSAP